MRALRDRTRRSIRQVTGAAPAHRPWRRPLALAAMLAVGAAAGTRTAAAHAWFTYGLGGAAIGMGNAFAALADDCSAGWTNPAGLVARTVPEVGVGFGFLDFDLSIDGRSAGVSDLGAFSFASSVPLPVAAPLGIDAAIGFAVQMPGDVLLEQDVALPTVPQLVLLESPPRMLHLLASFALEPIDGLGLGAGVLFFDGTTGELDLGLGARGEAAFEIDQELRTVLSPQAGLRLELGRVAPALEGATLGVVWRDRFFVPYRIPVTASLGGLPVEVDFRATALYVPRQVDVGVAYRAPRWALSADVLWNDWSAFPDPALAIDLELEIPLLPIAFTDSVARPPGFHDTVSVRVGAEVEALAWDGGTLRARAGYGFEPTPVPLQRGETSLLDDDRHVVSGGLGLALDTLFGRPLEHPLHLDAFLQAHVLDGRVHVKDPALAQRDDVPARVASSGHVLYAGLWLSAEWELFEAPAP